LAKEFLEHYLLTDDGLAIMDNAKPIGVPALVSMYQKLEQNNPRLRELKATVDYGQIMPNVPQMARFFSSLGAALQLAADGRLSARAALLQAAVNMRHD
jgi:maltose/maltodextrin transport system substrate-binding protein